MRCVVVDDEMPAREELKFLLNNINHVEIVGEAGDGKRALDIIQNTQPDVVFLDIQMRGMSGFDLAENLLTFKKIPFIVFITAYDQYAIQAFEINAVDYILKPISEERFKSTISRIQHLLEQKNQNTTENIVQLLKQMSLPKITQKFCVCSNDRHIPLDPKDIVYVSVEDRHTIIQSKKGKFTTNTALGELEEKLKEYNFFRCHRSYLINIDEILEIHNWFHGTYQVIMKGFEEKIPVSRSNAPKFKSIMNL